ncbi:DNA-processing protein DprA [Jeotgalicoccus meleagridis]|uniref:Smf/DprA SLOG domain-containing protein n=1 Tax=Jeotgalicoccus meleagridis TaxID=2759181 RepID=A0A6V7RN39_9STAP|nr:DNA-processing protein DprA [Jeotgalicoccus meleagridis]CAD2079148.1 hypothetical protein JEODO184_01592 [Jeotgalicoccus meleagridis]
MDLLLLSFAGVTAKEYLILKNGEAITPNLEKKLALYKNLSRQEILALLERKNVGFITYQHEFYPSLLKEIYDFPYLLYYRGKLELLKTDMLGVVGSRKASLYSEKALQTIFPDLNKITIISGLAYGADEFAHKTAMEVGLATIGVLAFGHDTHYPKSTFKVRNDLEKSQLTISEYPPHTQLSKWRFIARNRIIAGASRGVLVTEAEAKSGSLVTLDMALDENRNGYCLPGNITSSLSTGTNSRLKEGATLVTSASEIMQDYI